MSLDPESTSMIMPKRFKTNEGFDDALKALKLGDRGSLTLNQKAQPKVSKLSMPLNGIVEITELDQYLLGDLVEKKGMRKLGSINVESL